MTTIEMTVTGQNACAKVSGLLTSGTVGLPVEFSFDESWNGLIKTAVFRAGNVSRDVVDIGSAVTVPWEVMQKKNCTLQIGVYGVNADGTLVMPTVWADAGIVAPGADPAGDASTDPTQPVWQQTLLKATAAARAADIAAEEAGAAAADAQRVVQAYEAGELKGEKGDMPEKGVDYFTEEDIAGIAEMFIATYGKTTFAELENAYNAGKVVFCSRVDDGNNACCVPMTEYEQGAYMAFARTVSATSVVRYSCTAGNVWKMETQKCPSKHASSHAEDGSDPITPESIGAVSKTDFEQKMAQLHTAVIVTQKTSYEEVLASWNAGHKHILLEVADPDDSTRTYCVPVYSYQVYNGFTFRLISKNSERAWFLLTDGKWYYEKTAL